MQLPQPPEGLTGATADMWQYLQLGRERLVDALDGLSEYDIRRPLTPTGTNLLGLIKHCLGCEAEYLGNCVGRRPVDYAAWLSDGSVWENADMWATPGQTREELVGLYRSTWRNSDASLLELPPSAPAHVRWWPEGKQDTTLGHLLARVLADTSQHAGHADILRERLLPDSARDPALGDGRWWDAWCERLEDEAARHRVG